MTNLARRTALSLAAAMGLARPVRAAADPVAMQLLATLGPRRAAAAAIGRAGLRGADRQDAGALAAAIMAGLGPGEPGAAIAARCAEECAAGRLTRIDGWVLPETEAALCRLAALAEA